MTVEALADQAAAKGHELLYVSLSALPSFSIEDGEGGHIFLSRSLCGVQSLLEIRYPRKGRASCG